MASLDRINSDLFTRFGCLYMQHSQALIDASDPTKRNFADTYKHSEVGVYVEYPFKTGAPPMNLILPLSINRLVSLEQKFRRSSELNQKYEDFLDDYLHRGHMKPLTPANIQENAESVICRTTLSSRWIV